MRTYSIPLGTFAGVQLRAHWVFVLFGIFLVTQTMALHIAPSRGLALAGLALVTVLLHEFGHMVMASVTRARLRLILLMPLGGVSFYAPRKTAEAEEGQQRFLTQRQENAIALAGPFTSVLVAIVGMMVLAVVLNLLALPVYLLLPGINFFVFLGLNGYLLGRAYFEGVALRRLDTAATRAARHRFGGRIFLGGLVIAGLFSLPLVNLVAPVIATAFMVHLFEALRQFEPQVLAS